jgi:hypothetical protein
MSDIEIDEGGRLRLPRRFVPPDMDVYELFMLEMNGLQPKIKADDSAVSVVGVLTRAVKRAQMVANGELAPVAERAVPAGPTR